MKRLLGSFLAVLVFAVNSVSATEIDMLVNKLAEKNVITYGEAQQIITETKEEVRKDMAEGKVETLPKWLQKLSVDGVIYADYFYNLTQGAAPASIDAFELTRLYLTVREQVSDRVKIRATLEGSEGTAANALWIKYAYAEYSDIFRGSNVRMGVIQTPWISYEEDNLWKNRFMAKVMVDNEGIMNSADVGVGISGNIAGKLINYDATVMNGEGYKTPEVSQYKDFAARESVRITDAWKVHAYEQAGWAGLTGTLRNRDIVGFSYQPGDLNVVAYYLAGQDASVFKSGYSAYVIYNINKIISGLSVVARYDFYDPDTNVSNNSWHRIIAGFVFPVSAGVMGGIDVQTKNFEDPSQGNDQTMIFTHLGVTF